MNKYCYMKVTNDKYELPIAIADSAEELAEKCGTTKGVVYTSVTKSKYGWVNKNGTPKYFPYRKVEIGE